MHDDKLWDVLRKRSDFQKLTRQIDIAVAAKQKTANAPPVEKPAAADRKTVTKPRSGVAKEYPENSQPQDLLASVHHSVGLIQKDLKQHNEAEASLLQVLALRKELSQKSIDPAVKLGVLLAQYSLGKLYWDTQRQPQAHRIWQEVMGELDRLSKANKVNKSFLRSAGQLERYIGNYYGEIGLWPLAGVHADRNARHRRTDDPIWDSRFAVLMLNTPPTDNYIEYCKLLVGRLGQYDEASLSQMHLRWNLGVVERSGINLDGFVKLPQKGEIASRNSWYSYARALIQFRGGRLDDAKNSLAEASTSNGAVSALQYLKVLMLVAAGEDQAAGRLLAEAERIYCQSFLLSLTGKASNMPSELQWGSGDNWWELVHLQCLRAEAISKLSGAPTPPDAWQHLLQARGYRLLGELELAEHELAAAVAAAPDDVDIWLARAKLFDLWQEPQRAEADAERVAELTTSGEKLFQLAAWRLTRGDTQLADEQFETLRSQLPGFARAPFTAQTANTKQAQCAEAWGIPVEFDNSLGMRLRLIPPGEFMMGVPEAENKMIVNTANILASERQPLESNPAPHQVFLPGPFYLGQFEVTHGQFQQFIDATDYRTVAERSGLGGWSFSNSQEKKWIRRPEHTWSSPGPWQPDKDEPVSQISAEDAEAFCAWLSEKEGRRYRLPTEARWEFACRAGTAEATYASGGETLDDLAWFGDANVPGPQVVGRKLANPFGIHDMLGNVWEICADGYYHGPIDPSVPRIDPQVTSLNAARVVRGGAWYRQKFPWCHAGVRNAKWDNVTDAGFGFRVAIDLANLTPAEVQVAWPKQSVKSDAAAVE